MEQRVFFMVCSLFCPFFGSEFPFLLLRLFLLFPRQPSCLSFFRSLVNTICSLPFPNVDPHTTCILPLTHTTYYSVSLLSPFFLLYLKPVLVEDVVFLNSRKGRNGIPFLELETDILDKKKVEEVGLSE